MKKIVVFNMVSVDGFFAGPNGEIDWHNVDEAGEFNEFAISQLKEEVGVILFGRATYELMAGYWPKDGAIKDDPVVAANMNSLPKIVFSRTLEKAGWNNTTLAKTVDPAEINRMKQEIGKDIFIFGSGQLVQEFARLGLVDEYRLMVNPVALGSGKVLFKDKTQLLFLGLKEFKNGNVLLRYKPVK